MRDDICVPQTPKSPHATAYQMIHDPRTWASDPERSISLTRHSAQRLSVSKTQDRRWSQKDGGHRKTEQSNRGTQVAAPVLGKFSLRARHPIFVFQIALGAHTENARLEEYRQRISRSPPRVGNNNKYTQYPHACPRQSCGTVERLKFPAAIQVLLSIDQRCNLCQAESALIFTGRSCPMHKRILHSTYRLSQLTHIKDRVANFNQKPL